MLWFDIEDIVWWIPTSLNATHLWYTEWFQRIIDSLTILTWFLQQLFSFKNEISQYHCQKFCKHLMIDDILYNTISVVYF